MDIQTASGTHRGEADQARSRYDAVLFDLDGTLLPMDFDTFMKGYLGLLVKTLAPFGYDKDRLVGDLWKGVGAMARNDGSMPNRTRFWETFAQGFPEKFVGATSEESEALLKRQDDLFLSFYANEFDGARAYTSPAPEAAREAVASARRRADRVILATNPFFPAVAIERRLSWVGLRPDDFDYVTTYETSSFCKPNPLYYREVLARFDLEPAGCLMVGNDVAEDIAPTEGLGMGCFLVTDCLIDKAGAGTDVPSGSMGELITWLS